MLKEWCLSIHGNFQSSVQGFARIVELNGRQMETKHTPIGITGFSITGLRFTTNLRLPKHDKIIWRFQIEVDDIAILLCGTIWSSSQLANDDYEYHVSWKKELAVRESVRYLYDKLSTEFCNFNLQSFQHKKFDMLG